MRSCSLLNPELLTTFSWLNSTRVSGSGFGCRPTRVGFALTTKILNMTDLSYSDWPHPIGFHTWKQSPFNNNYLNIGGHKGAFLGFVSVLMQASFSFFGSEVPGIVCPIVIDDLTPKLIDVPSIGSRRSHRCNPGEFSTSSHHEPPSNEITIECPKGPTQGLDSHVCSQSP